MGIVELGLELVCVREANRFEMGRLYRGGAASRWRWLAFCGGRKKLWALEMCALCSVFFLADAAGAYGRAEAAAEPIAAGLEHTQPGFGSNRGPCDSSTRRGRRLRFSE
jgi:hypothetical protein